MAKSPVDRLRAICLALPEANEKLSHGEPTWFAGKGKVFAMLDDHHHGAKHLSVWLPAALGAQEALIESDPKRFFRPPYVGRQRLGGRGARQPAQVAHGRLAGRASVSPRGAPAPGGQASERHPPLISPGSEKYL